VWFLIKMYAVFRWDPLDVPALPADQLLNLSESALPAGLVWILTYRITF
jgi:hypothetical protein